MLVCSLSSLRDLHKNKGHKSVLVRENISKPPPSVMAAFGKTVIFHHHEQDDPTWYTGCRLVWTNGIRRA